MWTMWSGRRPAFDKGAALMSKENEEPSLDQDDGADVVCGDSETVQMAQVSCCMTIKVLAISLAVCILSPYDSLRILCGFVH